MSDKFVCKQCKKERDDFPRGVGSDGTTCWECEALNYYNNHTVKEVDNLLTVAKNHVTTRTVSDEHITSILAKLAETFQHHDGGESRITITDIEHIESTLDLILEKKY